MGALKGRADAANAAHDTAKKSFHGRVKKGLKKAFPSSSTPYEEAGKGGDTPFEKAGGE